MALSESAMAALIKANIQAIPSFPADGKTANFINDAVLVAICKGVIDHIKAAMLVTSTGTVTSGAGAGGAVTAASTTIT